MKKWLISILTFLFACLGDAASQNDLGKRYSDGEGVAQDYMQAVYWYQKAAAQGNVHAQYNLGYMYSAGRGVFKDYEQAAYWFRKAAFLKPCLSGKFAPF